MWSDRLFSRNLFVGFILFCLMITRVAPHQIKPLRRADAKTSQRISYLEMNFSNNHPFFQPLSSPAYQDIGEFPCL
jgi:hypothetical protein